ncbi:MAG: hypothetical protein Q8O67_22350 [Deltaproteobacteria bacterium]|nr:hypothetical protein [Deltaproteobacteria bacterium]
MIGSWPVVVVVVAVCGAVVPGPCGYAPDPAFDCSAGDPCARNLACVLVDPSSPDSRGFCRSADVACEDGELLCAVPGLDRSGLCVPEEQLSTSSTHCGDCFARCRGGAQCVDGACVDEPVEGACVIERGNFDCGAGEGCVDGACVDDAAGPGGILAACEDGGDCDGGLCVEGVCSRPCDFGCAPTTACDDDAIPGGLCVPVPESGCFE